MIEIILGLIIAALLVKSVFDEKAHYLERDRLMKAIMAKNLPEYEDSVTIKEPIEPKIDPDIPMEQANESLFKKHIQSIIDGQSEDGEHTE